MQIYNYNMEELKKMAHDQEEKNRTVPVSGQRIKIPLDGRTLDAVYYPAARNHAPLMLALHGGGFLAGGCALDDKVYDSLRKTCGVNVLSVGYRKGSDNLFPRPLDDVYDSILWMLDHVSVFCFDSRKIILSGVGAGATLAMSCQILAFRRREFHVNSLLLIEPLVGLDPELLQNSKTEMLKDNHWHEELLAYYWFPLSGNSWELLENPLFAPQKHLPDSMGPDQRIVILTSSDPTYVEKIQPMIRFLQDCGICVEWRVSDTEGTPGIHIDYLFLKNAIERCYSN